MNPKPEAILGEVILKFLPILKKSITTFTTLRQKWRLHESGVGADGFQVQEPDLEQALGELQSPLKTEAKTFSDSFFSYHPEFGDMVGFTIGEKQNFRFIANSIFDRAFRYLWSRHKTFDLDHSVVEQLVKDFGDFIDNKHADFTYHAQLLNFHSSAENIQMPSDLEIRKLNDDEISSRHGHLIFEGTRNPRSILDCLYVLEGKVHVPIIIGNPQTQKKPDPNPIRGKIDKGILSLRTFKKGVVGYDIVSFFSQKFCPVGISPLGYGDLYLPHGHYSLKDNEIESFISHANSIFKASDAALLTACNRLADAETRRRPQDKILDAVIGMEAILLAGEHVELSYRFGINYALLFPEEERFDKLGEAKFLYKLRSAIAHGMPSDKIKSKYQGQSLHLNAVANMAVEALRHVVKYSFLNSENFNYSNLEYWQKKCLGLS